MANLAKRTSGAALSTGRQAVTALRGQLAKTRDALSRANPQDVGSALLGEGLPFLANGIASAADETDAAKSLPVSAPAAMALASGLAAFALKGKARRMAVRYCTGTLHALVSKLSRRIPAAVKEATK